jgi:hypothetical protein
VQFFNLNSKRPFQTTYKNLIKSDRTFSDSSRFFFFEANRTAALIMLKCHFIVMASNELTSVREVMMSAEERP